MDISREEYNSLLNVIKIRYDLDFTCYEPNSFNRRISRAISVLKLNGIHELWLKLLRDKSFIFKFVNEITVGMTSLFRDPKMWKDLKTLMRTKLKEKEKLSIYHAGCCSGEEVFSMAILIDELGAQNRIKSLAVDLNGEFLKTAKKGNYQKNLWEDYKKNYREFNPIKELKSYLSTDNPEVEGIQFNTSLVKNVLFDQQNILNFKPEKKVDLIFCRNVMIYFDSKTKLKLLDVFYDSLDDGGLLIIGFYDSMSTLIDSKKFSLQNAKNKIFKKIG